MNLNTQWKKWAQAFIAAKTECMDAMVRRAFLMCCMTETTGAEIGQGFKEEFSYKIIDKRAALIGLNMTDAVKLMLCMLANTPGIAVMYVYALRYYQVTEKLPTISTKELAMLFPLGFPIEAELHRLWDLQKNEHGNLLDQITKEVTEE